MTEKAEKRGERLLVLPEAAGEEDENGEDFQTTHQHQQGEEPFDDVGQVVPGHRGTYLQTERGAYIAGAAEGDGEGVGAVDAQNHHNEIDEETEHHIGCEEGEEGLLAVVGDYIAVDADRQHGSGVQDATELVAQHLPQHDDAHTFEAATRGAGTATNEHADGEDDPCEVWPLAGIVVEDTGGGEERDDLEQAGTEGGGKGIVAATHDDEHDEQRAHKDDGDVEPKLGVPEELYQPALEQGDIEECEAGAAEEHEEDGRVVDGGAMEVAGAGVVRGEATGGRDCHGVVDAVETAHAFEVEAEGADGGEQRIDAPDPMALGAEARVHLDAHRPCGLGREDFHATTHHRGDDGDGEEDDAEAADPLGEAAPEEQGMGQAFHIVDERGSRGGEAGDGLEVGIGDGREIAAQVEGEAAEEAEDGPYECHHQEGVAARHRRGGAMADIMEGHAGEEGGHHGNGEGIGVILAIATGHHPTAQHERGLHTEQLADDLPYNLPIDQFRLTFSV